MTWEMVFCFCGMTRKHGNHSCKQVIMKLTVPCNSQQKTIEPPKRFSFSQPSNKANAPVKIVSITVTVILREAIPKGIPWSTPKHIACTVFPAKKPNLDEILLSKKPLKSNSSERLV